MAKGQMRSNKEAKKPKKDKLAAATRVTGVGAGSAGNPGKKSTPRTRGGRPVPAGRRRLADFRRRRPGYRWS